MNKLRYQARQPCVQKLPRGSAILVAIIAAVPGDASHITTMLEFLK